MFGGGGGYPQQQWVQQPQQNMQYPQQQPQQMQYPQQQQQQLGAFNPPPQQSQHYGSYGQQLHQNAFALNAWQCLQYDSEADLQHMFENNKSQIYNGVQAQELCKILNETPRIRDYYRINWSLELCKIMIAMLDRSKDGMMQYNEFRELLQCLTYWHSTFTEFDGNRTGFLETSELYRLITNKFGYRISSQTLECLLKRHSRAMDDGRVLIAFDDFVVCCVRLRAYTEAFRARDRMEHQGQESGSATFSYDDFLQCVMCL